MDAMAEKLLSIIVPTYNMEALLPHCLDSLLVPEALELLEVVVVNDGSKDGSLAIARDYERRYPDTLVVIDKPNGNYGSTINAALPVIRGKYVKILDADDSFDPAALVRFLDALSETDVDFAVTHYTILKAGGKTEVARYSLYGREPYEYGRVYDFDEVLGGGYIRFFLMHSITYRTAMLRANGYHQTEGISYTDLEWDTYPLFYVRTIAFFDINLYLYNMAREGQTMDPKVLVRSVGQLETVTSQILSYLDANGVSHLSPVRQAFIRQYYLNRLRLVCKSHLFDVPRDSFDAAHFAALDSAYQEVCRKFSLGEIRLYPENKIIHVNAMRYWHKHHRRWPAWFERFNVVVNKLVTRAYILLFRR